MNSKKPFLMRIECLDILIPPDVEPDDAPKNINPKNNIVRKGVHPAKSAVTKPVVVIIATIWKKACLKLDSSLPKISGCSNVVCCKSTKL